MKALLAVALAGLGAAEHGCFCPWGCSVVVQPTGSGGLPERVRSLPLAMFGEGVPGGGVGGPVGTVPTTTPAPAATLDKTASSSVSEAIAANTTATVNPIFGTYSAQLAVVGRCLPVPAGQHSTPPANPRRPRYGESPQVSQRFSRPCKRIGYHAQSLPPV